MAHCGLVGRVFLVLAQPLTETCFLIHLGAELYIL